jgi:hypothetical protein
VKNDTFTQDSKEHVVGASEFVKYEESRDVAKAKCEVRPPSFWQYLSCAPADSKNEEGENKNGKTFHNVDDS